MRFVCVPLDYDNNSFCGLDAFCRHESCESLIAKSNQCYEPVCDNGIIKIAKRDNATAWENKTTGCYEFQCHNESGPVYWKQCNKTKEVCENDQCVISNKEVVYSVIIETVEGVDVTEFSTTEVFSTISILTGIEADRIKIRVETNDRNGVTHIIIVVDDTTTAEVISNSFNTAIEERSEEGIIRLCRSAHVEVNERCISCGMKKEEGMIIVMSMIFMAFFHRDFFCEFC